MTSRSLQSASQHRIRLAETIRKHSRKLLGYSGDSQNRAAWDGRIFGLPVGMSAKRRIHLTFDDGPHPENTPKVLDELRRADVSATFFVIGKNLEESSARKVLQRMAAEGHQVANHTYSHPLLTDLSKNQIRDEIMRAEKLIGAANRGVKLLRPPMGEFNPLVQEVAEELGYTIVLWNVDSCDWRPNYETIWIDHTMRQIALQRDCVIVAHDGLASTITTIGNLVARIRELPDVRLVRSQDAFGRRRPWQHISERPILFPLKWEDKGLGT